MPSTAGPPFENSNLGHSKVLRRLEPPSNSASSNIVARKPGDDTNRRLKPARMQEASGN